MKKLFLLIIEINNLVFAWYVFMALAIVGIDTVTGGFLARMGISRGTVYTLVGASALLEAMRVLLPALRRAPKILPKGTIMNAREFLSFGLTGAGIIWGSFLYGEAVSVTELAAQGGLPHAAAGAALAIALFFGATMNANEGLEEDEPKGEDVKEAYRNREESSVASGKKDAFPLWAYVHGTEYTSIAEHIPAGATALDNGCGDGTLAIMLAKRGVIVTACDISEANITKARRHAEEAGAETAIRFLVADAENLPFENNSFDWVVSSHVLEHLPSFEKGLAEIRRVTKRSAVIALPTCLNPCAAVILGGDVFWKISRWSPFAWFVGLGRILLNAGGTGVDEGYRGDKSLPHVWRYPHVMRRELRKGGFRILRFEASSLCLPHFESLLPLIKKLEKYKAAPLLRQCGYGSIAVVEKI